MFVILVDRSERVVDIVTDWFRWLSSFRAWLILAIVLGLLGGLAAHFLTGTELLVFAVILSAVLFAIGPLGEVYSEARSAWLSDRYRLRDLPAAPSRQEFWLAVAAEVALLALSIAGCIGLLGAGWSRVPVLDPWSPWTVVILSLAMLFGAEVAAQRRVRFVARNQEQSLAVDSAVAQAAQEMADETRRSAL